MVMGSKLEILGQKHEFQEMSFISPLHVHRDKGGPRVITEDMFCVKPFPGMLCVITQDTKELCGHKNTMEQNCAHCASIRDARPGQDLANPQRVGCH